MGQAMKPAALVVEDDANQRYLIGALLEECDMRVIECESGEAATIALDHLGDSLVMVFADVRLAGRMTGVEFAAIAKKRFPTAEVVLTSGRSPLSIPPNTMFMQKPWRALDVLRVAERARA
jgi:CheY-like chemotaxis protein